MRRVLLLSALLALALGLCCAADASSYRKPPFIQLPEQVNATNIDSALRAWRESKGMGDANAGVFGVDVSNGGNNVQQWSCLRQQGFSFAIVRAYRSLCSPDPVAKGTIAAAWAGGMNYVDVYLFPAYSCAKSATQQVNEMLDSLAGARFGQVWMDVETHGSAWSSNAAANVRWLREAITAAEKRLGPGRVGIYTNANSWITVMGNDGTFGKYPDWYAHYDGVPNFNSFRPFGGWSRPAIKQYADGPPVCGIGIDHNWYPA